MSAYRFGVVNLTEDDPEQIATAHVSAYFFRLFGAPIVTGRSFSAAEDLPNGGRVAVLSEGFWRRRFGGDATVVGRKVSLNGEPSEVIGVLGAFDSEAVQSPTGSPDIWLPFQIDPNSVMQGHFFLAAGRLKSAILNRSRTSPGPKCPTPTAPISSTSRRSPGSCGHEESRLH